MSNNDCDIFTALKLLIFGEDCAVWPPPSAQGFVVTTVLDQTLGFRGEDGRATTIPGEARVYDDPSTAGIDCEWEDDRVAGVSDLAAFRAAPPTW